MATQFAICTLLTNDGYLPGALALVAALRDLHPRPSTDQEVDFTTVCLVTPETVDVSSIKLLRKAFDIVVGVEVIEPEDDKGLHLLGRLDLNQVLTKLHVFRLTQYSKIIFLDADVLPIRPLSHLLTLPQGFSAVPDVGWPDIFNSGVMVLTPSEASFDELMELQRTTGSWDGGDQGVLNEWRGGNWNRLSFTYNTTPTAAYTYAPAYERFGSKISAIHFIGSNKPWKQIPYRAPGSKEFRQQIEEGQHAYDYSSLVDRWFAVYDRHYRVTSVPPGGTPKFEVPRYQATWDEGTSLGAEVLPSAFTPAGPTNHSRVFPSSGLGTALGIYPGPSGSAAAVNLKSSGALGLDELRKMAVEGMNSVSGPFFVDGRLGEYRSMPLNGRIDLMRPKREPKPPHKNEQDQGPPAQDGQGHWHGGDDEHHQPPGNGGPPPPSGGHGASHGSVGGQEYSPSSGQGGSQQASDQGGQRYHGGGGQDHYQQHGENHYPQSSDSEWYPTTGHLIHLSVGSTPRIDPLPTPDPRELPPAPRPHLRHLPSSQGYNEHHRQAFSHLNQPPFQTFLEQNGHNAHHRHHRSSPTDQFGHGHDHEHRHNAPNGGHHEGHHQHGGHRYHYLHHDRYLPQERPQSPPMMVWNPAIDPPPNNPPPTSSFPQDTYFENVWDKSHAEHLPQGSLPVQGQQTDDEPFFHTTAPLHIPQTLIQQGHYQSVTGPAPQDRPGHHVQPTPDRNKVKPTFPWEEQPRHVPRRIFPKSDSPPPSAVFIEEDKPLATPPIVPPPPSSAPPISRRISQSQVLMSPPGVFPGTIGYANAWDVVPAIQKYASKLVRPEDRPLMPRPAPPVIDDREYVQNRDWDKDAEIGSQDADDEDEDDEDEGSRSRRSRDEDVDFVQEGVQTPRIERPTGLNIRHPSGVRSRSGTGTASPTQSFLVSRKKKEYRDAAVQTDLVETRPKGVQVSSVTQVNPSTLRKPGSRTQSASSGMSAGRPNLGELRRESFSRTPTHTGLGLGLVGEEQWRGRVESLPSRRPGIPLFADGGVGPLAPPALIRNDSWRMDRRLSNPAQPSTTQFPTKAIRTGSPVQRTVSPQITSPPKTSPPIRSPKLSNASTTSAATTIALLTPTSVRGGLSSLGHGRPKLADLSTVERTASGASVDTAILSPPESITPATPYDTFGHSQSLRKRGRVWDPNTGVEAIKRGSEEVLARFLRLNSWEDEEATGGR